MWMCNEIKLKKKAVENRFLVLFYLIKFSRTNKMEKKAKNDDDV